VLFCVCIPSFSMCIFQLWFVLHSHWHNIININMNRDIY
jgi:hypothetical protein